MAIILVAAAGITGKSRRLARPVSAGRAYFLFWRADGGCLRLAFPGSAVALEYRTREEGNDRDHRHHHRRHHCGGGHRRRSYVPAPTPAPAALRPRVRPAGRGEGQEDKGRGRTG